MSQSSQQKGAQRKVTRGTFSRVLELSAEEGDQVLDSNSVDDPEHNESE